MTLGYHIINPKSTSKCLFQISTVRNLISSLAQDYNFREIIIKRGMRLRNSKTKSSLGLLLWSPKLRPATKVASFAQRSRTLRPVEILAYIAAFTAQSSSKRIAT